MTETRKSLSLILKSTQLEKIGFIEKSYKVSSLDSNKVIENIVYELEFGTQKRVSKSKRKVFSCIAYNNGEWQIKQMAGFAVNINSLEIRRIEDLYTLLRCFKAKFNMLLL